MANKSKSPKIKLKKGLNSTYQGLISRYKWINKYWIFLGGFVVWICFIDNHNLIKQRKMTNSINDLELKKKNYILKLEEVKEQQIDLTSNVEKLAREKYGFAAENEDVFIIEPKKKK